jgi:hypothetical protein
MASTHFSMPVGRLDPWSIADGIKRGLTMLNAVRAASAVTGNAPTPSARSWSAPLAAQDSAVIAQGHAERRLQLAQRRAVQQLEVLLQASQRLGVNLSTDAMAKTVIAAYTDTMNCARR